MITYTHSNYYDDDDDEDKDNSLEIIPNIAKTKSTLQGKELYGAGW